MVAAASLAVGGVLAGLAIQYLPGRGGASPAGGFAIHGAPTPAQLPGVIFAAPATLVFGAVLGPEMPLIAIGGGLAVLATPRRQAAEGARPGGQGAG
jgi:H+/Cl- antiporter ClcA